MSVGVHPDFGLAFESASARIKGEREERAKLVARELRFNIDFLDDALGGILPNDLILMGARTGAGKTALASMIAQSNARAGKRVHYFALEAEPREIERRMKYRALVGVAFPKLYAHERARLSYRDWYRGKLDDLLGRFEEAADKSLAAYATLFTYYRGEQFSIDDLDRTFRSIRDATDLIVLDHLHYVDTEDPNENRGYKAITKRIRDISLSSGVPIIVIAHLRKKERGVQRVVPELDDFHGTSDIVKIATKCLLIAPAPSTAQTASHLWATYMQVPKDRMDGTASRYVGHCYFDVRLGAYKPGYRVGMLNVPGTEWTEAAERDRPRWARAESAQQEMNAAE